MMMKLLPFLFFIFCFFPLFSQDSTIIAYDIVDSIYEKKAPHLNKYRSKINFPPFIGWSKNDKKMLFNGGKSIYSMSRVNAEIREFKKLKRGFSSYLSPNQQQFIYLEDQDGDENYQLFLYDIPSKKMTTLSKKGDKSYDPYWSEDSKQIVYKSNKIDSARVDLYMREIKSPYLERMVFEDFSDDGMIYDWSHALGKLVAVKVISENDKQLYLIDQITHEHTQINKQKNNIAYADAKFIPNQQACLIVSDQETEFLQLYHYDLNTKQFRNLTADIPWDVEALSIAKNGTYAAFSINENGFSKLYLLDLTTWKYNVVSNFPKGIIGNLAVNKKGTEVGFNLYGSTFRRKIYSYDIVEGKLKQWNRKGKMQTDPIDFIEAKAFFYTSQDTETGETYQIPAFIYEPTETAKPSAVFIDIHGGPEYQARASFNSFYQYLVQELGIAVIVPNIRGSNGYGKSYMKMDDGKKRENAIEDVGALLDWIKQQAQLDEQKVAIYGESYGGYVALASLAKFPTRIRCGIDIVGITNWLTYLKNTSDYRKNLRRVEFGDERIPEMKTFLQNISPVNHVNTIQSPIFIVQGYNDPRVHYKESVQMYDSLNAKGNTVWFVMAKNEGHGFQHYENYMLQQQLIVSFLKLHLMK